MYRPIFNIQSKHQFSLIPGYTSGGACYAEE